MAFQYTGYRTLIYFKYLDRQAEHVLVADPGGEYDILATESGLSVPPGDGNWVQMAPPLPSPKTPPPSKLPPLSDSKAASSDEKAGE